jgi:hypothetical protein
LILSLELLLLLAVVVLLPLIQQLLQAAQQRDPRTPEGAERPPLRKPQASTHVPPPATLAIPPRPEIAPDAMTARGHTPAQDAAGPLPFALTPHRIARRRSAADLRNRLDLRGAIVLMAILGPCRAINPYD